MRLSELMGARPKVLNVSGGCHNCPRKLQRFCKPKLVDAPFIMISEIPGDTDVMRGEPLSGDSGMMLRRELAMNGLMNYAITTLVHCQPPKDAEGNQKDATDTEIKACMNQYVLKEIEPYPLVVLVGNQSIKAFFPKMRSSHLRGNIAYHPDFPGKRFYCLRSPLQVIKRSEGDPELEQWKREIARLASIVRGENRRFHVIQGGSDFLIRLKHMLDNTHRIGFDAEMTDLQHWDPRQRLRSIAVASNTNEAFFAHEDEPHFWPALELIKQFLLQRHKQVIGHHIGFDLKWLERVLNFTVKAEFIFDTGVIYYQYKQYKQVSLKELSSREGNGYRFLVYEPHLERDLDLLGLYNCEDVIQVLELHEPALRMLPAKTRDLYIRVAGPSDLALERLRHNGVHLISSNHAQVEKDLQEKREVIIQRWREADPHFRPIHVSGNGLEEYLFKIRGFPVIKNTKKGPSTDESVLKELIRQGYGKAELQCLLDLREVEKQLGTYVLPYKELVSIDGRIHANYNNTVTDTGRTSSNEPNFQNVPRKKYIRDLFGVPEGYTLLQSDFSQIELRIVMCLSRDTNGMNAYLRGEDLHTETARQIAGTGEPSKEQRTWAKAINFALCYGGTAWTVQSYARDTYGIEFTEQQAQDFCNLFFTTYPYLALWHRQCNEELVANQGWAEHAVGHRFYYKDWNNPIQGIRDHSFRAHINSKGQGPAGYMAIYTLILAQRAFAESGIDARTIGTVHDSILTEVRSGSEADAIAILNGCVERVHRWVGDWFKVPLIMDHEVGPSWGSLKKWKAA